MTAEAAEKLPSVVDVSGMDPSSRRMVPTHLPNSVRIFEDVATGKPAKPQDGNLQVIAGIGYQELFLLAWASTRLARVGSVTATASDRRVGVRRGGASVRGGRR
jgi:hypothetical protein